MDKLIDMIVHLTNQKKKNVDRYDLYLSCTYFLDELLPTTGGEKLPLSSTS